jgi:uncharacterized protein (TIGR03067 family)
LLLALTSGLAPAAEADQPGVKSQLKKLQGTWKVVRVEADGRPLPAEGWTLTIQGDRYALRSGQEAVEGMYKLAGLEEPLVIDATRTNGADKGKTLWGIYRLEGDQLKMCFNRPGEEVRPKEFATGRKGGGHRLYVLTQVKAKE